MFPVRMDPAPEALSSSCSVSETKNDAGEKVDNTTEDAEITNSTSVMMTTIAGNKGAIGYVSLGSLNDTVKQLTLTALRQP